jgi:hypothetical protein
MLLAIPTLPPVHDYRVGRLHFQLLNLAGAKATLHFSAKDGDLVRFRETTRSDITGQYTGRERWAEVSEAAPKERIYTVCRLTELDRASSV